MSFFITEEFIFEYKALFSNRFNHDYEKYKEQKYIKNLEKHRGDQYQYEKLNEEHLMERLDLYKKLIDLTPDDSPLKLNLFNCHAHLMMILCSKL